MVLSAVIAACGAGRTVGRGNAAARAGDWDSAVEYYRQAVQERPGDVAVQIALERAMLSASRAHLDQARVAEARGQLDEALREYRRASQYDPPNGQIVAKILDLERAIRDQIEAATARPTAQQLREAARPPAPAPLVNLNTVVQPIRFQQASLRDILSAIGEFAGINITYDSTYQDRVYSVALEGVTLGEALASIITGNQLFYKVVNPKTILVIPDTAPKRAQYEEQVVMSFPISYVDAQELAQTISTVTRTVGQQLAPTLAANKTTNTITVRATTALMDIITRMIDQLDKPAAEVLVDLQILEVNRNRAKQFGLDLGSYSINAVFSPESDPRDSGDGNGGGLTPRPFNLNTVTRGVSATDFFAQTPAALVRFLETDTETKVLAKPQLRGAAGEDLRFNLGEDIPVPSTTFTPLAQGGANFNPLTSFTYRPVGLIVEMTPEVSVDGNIRLDLSVESSSLGAGVTIAGQDLPSFGSRKVETVLRLREGESTLLAGLLQEQERRSLRGLPWLMNLPVIRQLFSSNDNAIQQTDIVMLLTPRIVRTRELTADDLAPIYVGTQTSLGLTGPPPLIETPESPDVGTPPAGTPPPVGTGPDTVPPAGAGGTAPPVGAVPGGGAAVPGPAAASAGQILVSVPGPEFRLGGGPYLVPVSITGASQLSGVTLTITYDPGVLRLVNVQEGSFMRAGGIGASFTQQADPAGGRVDVAIVRSGDVTGVAGTGLLAGLLFEAVGQGAASLAVSGSATGPGGRPVVLQFAPVAEVRVP